MRRALLVMLLAASAATFVVAQSEKLDYAMLGSIRDEGLNRSQVMDHVSWLSDVYGPRLTGSPGIQQASEWTMKKFREWGLANVHQERWSFGKGWSLVRFTAHLVEPQIQPLIGFPQEWSSGTKGPVTADVVRVQITSEADLEKYRGKLRGTIVLAQPARRVRLLDGPIILRMTGQDLAEAETTPVPGVTSGGGRGQAAATFRQKVSDFYLQEGVVAVFDRGSDSDMAAGGSDLSWQQQHPDGGTIFPNGASPRDDKAGKGVPVIALAVEHYNRMIRVLDKNVPVKVELNVETKFYDETTPNGLNTLAELPGTDLASEVVLLGAHFDSHPYATGATDNATGSAAMMEALRILKAIGVKPRRTIRLALWGGEEQGLLGSRAYVARHFYDSNTKTPKPGHENVQAYFNLDNGTGRILGIWGQGNTGAMKNFEQWGQALKDLGWKNVSPRSVTQTDHGSFEEAGIPGFQFIQERLDYNSRTHHSNMDTFDHVQKDDVIQQGAVAAVFAWYAANTPERLPRKAPAK